MSKTLALSDIILKRSHVSILRSPEWALSSLPTAFANTQTSVYHLYKKFTGPFNGLARVILELIDIAFIIGLYAEPITKSMFWLLSSSHIVQTRSYITQISFLLSYS